MKGKRVLFLNHSAKLGGAEVRLLTLLEALNSKEKINPVLISGENGALVDRAKEKNIEVKVIELPERIQKIKRTKVKINPFFWAFVFLGLVKYIFRLFRWVGKNNIELIHSNSFKAHFYGALIGFLANKPVIWRIRDIIDKRSFSWLGVWLTKIFVKIFKVHIVPVSESAAAPFYNMGVDEERVEIIFNGIKIPRLDKIKCRQKLRDEFDWPKNTYLIGTAGRIIPEMGVKNFIKLAKKLEPSLSRAKFLVVGSSQHGSKDYFEGLKSEVSKSPMKDKIIFTGFREDIMEIMSAMDLFVFPAVIPSALPGVILEAMSVKTPVAAFDIDAANEIITHGKTGFISPLGDIDDMKKQSSKVLKDKKLRLKITGKAREEIKNRYIIERYINDMRELMLGYLK
ncbi:MAG: glycosyltransferase family 4 protein [Elusimicrobiota bacterium]